MLTFWQLSTIAVKWIFNMAGLLAVGSTLFRIYMPELPATIELLTRQLTLQAAGIAFFSTLIMFLFNVALFSHSGFMGLFDIHIIKILFSTPIGESMQLRLMSLALIALSYWQWRLSTFFALLGVILFLFSFLLLGHTVSHSWFVSICLAAHLLSVSFWMGALWPLYKLCRYPDMMIVSKVMNDFGNIAFIWLGILVFCGVVLTTVLLPALSSLIYTDYGKLLGIKLIIVIILLSLALLNKVKLVPYLNTAPCFINRLRIVILLEIGLIMSIILITTLFTTIVGPNQ